MNERARQVALLAGATIVAVATPAAIVLGVRADDAFAVAFSVAFVTYGVMGLLILWRRPGNAVGRILLTIGIVEPLTSVASSYAVLDLPAATWVGWASSPGTAVVFGGILIFLPLLFPTGTFLSPRWRGVGIAALVALVLMTIVLAVAPGPLDCCPGLQNPVRVPGLEWLQAIIPFLFPVVAAFAVAAFASVVVRYRRSRGDERLQMKWFTFAVAWMAVATVAGAAAGAGLIRESTIAPLLIFPVGAASIAVAVGIAVLRYRLYDIDVVIKKTIVYGALAAFITTVYVGVVVGIGNAIGTGGEPNLALSIVATALVAVAFHPVRMRVQHVANRLVYGKRATPYEVLSHLAEGMTESHAIEEVLPRLARMLAEGTGATHVEVWLRVGDTIRPAGAWPRQPSATVLPALDGRLPELPNADRTAAVVHRGELLGALSLSKPPADPPTSADEKLLADVAAQAGLVLRNVRLTEELKANLEELRASRERIVAAQDEERRRIERNIHDGAQQQLVALAVNLKLARTLAAKDPVKVQEMLERLQSDTQHALEDLRDLARGIYPPLLADKGLAAALEAQARKGTLPVSIDPDGVGRFSKEGEAAVYFCVLEALQNAAKYAEASRATVRLHRDDGHVGFEVEDDGRGFDPARTPRGAGLQNMTDRIEALGGSIEVRSAPGAGTTVVGRLPTEPVKGPP